MKSMLQTFHVIITSSMSATSPLGFARLFLHCLLHSLLLRCQLLFVFVHHVLIRLLFPLLHLSPLVFPSLNDSRSYQSLDFRLFEDFVTALGHHFTAHHVIIDIVLPRQVEHFHDFTHSLWTQSPRNGIALCESGYIRFSSFDDNHV